MTANVARGSEEAGFYIGDSPNANAKVVGNDFGRNEPNIFWDAWGSGNRFAENNCDTSVPARLCR